MKAIERHIEEIRQYKTAREKTDSRYLKNDYSKKINHMMKELREYCHYRNYNYKAILRRLNAESKRNKEC